MNLLKLTPTTSRSGRGVDWVVGAVQAVHVVPCVAVTVLSVSIALITGQSSSVLLMAGAVFSGQCAIGLSNDFIDRHRDRAADRLAKPIVSGKISARSVVVLSVVSLVLSAASSLLYGFVAGSLYMIALSSAFAYNLWLKSSVLSVATYGFSFGLLPLFIARGAAVPYVPSLWLILAAALFGAGVHFQDVLPDMLDDIRTGVRGLPHRFSYERAMLASVVLLVLSFMATGLGPADSQATPFDVGIIVLFLIALLVFAVYYRLRSWSKAWNMAQALSVVCALAVVGAARIVH